MEESVSWSDSLSRLSLLTFATTRGSITGRQKQKRARHLLLKLLKWR